MKRRIFVSLLLIAAMVLTSAEAAFAATATDRGTFVLPVKEQRILLREQGKVSTITLTEKGKKTIVSVKDNSSGKKYSFTRDKENNTVTSSITGNTIPIDSPENSALTTSAASAASWYKYVSYRSIAGALGDITTAAALLAFLMSFAGMAAVIATVTTAISGALWTVNAYLPAASASHGIRLTLNYKTITKRQGGSVITVKIVQGVGMRLY